jgi:hypothetical protein
MTRLITIAVAVAAVLAVILRVPVAAVAGGLALTLWLPGAALVRILFGARDLSAAERYVLPVALSLAVPVLGGIALDAAGIRLTATAWALLAGSVTVLATVPGTPPARPAVAPGVTPAHGKRPGAWRVRLAVPLALIFLASAATVSLRSADRQWRSVAVTELSVQPAAGGRVAVDVTTANTTDATYRLVVTGAAGFTTTLAPRLARTGDWHSSVVVPDGGRITAALYRDGVPYRSVFLDRS